MPLGIVQSSLLADIRMSSVESAAEGIPSQNPRPGGRKAAISTSTQVGDPDR